MHYRFRGTYVYKTAGVFEAGSVEIPEDGEFDFEVHDFMSRSPRQRVFGFSYPFGDGHIVSLVKEAPVGDALLMVEYEFVKGDSGILGEYEGSFAHLSDRTIEIPDLDTVIFHAHTMDRERHPATLSITPTIKNDQEIPMPHDGNPIRRSCLQN